LTGFSSLLSSDRRKTRRSVDQEAIGFTAQVDADRHRRLAVLGLGQAEPGAHVDHGDDAAAQVQHTRDSREDKGTRVTRSGMNTSWTREIGSRTAGHRSSR